MSRRKLFAGTTSEAIPIHVQHATTGDAAGDYELGLPNAALAAGAAWVAVRLRGATDMRTVRIEIELDAANYRDGANLGLTTPASLLTRIPGVIQPQTGDAYAVVSHGTHGNAALKALIDAVDAVVDAIVADTGTDGVVLSSATRAAIATTLFADTTVDGISLAAIFRCLAAFAFGISEFTDGGVNKEIKFYDPDGEKLRLTVVFNVNGRHTVTVGDVT
jgi:hypothetical protein